MFALFNSRRYRTIMLSLFRNRDKFIILIDFHNLGYNFLRMYKKINMNFQIKLFLLTVLLRWNLSRWPNFTKTTTSTYRYITRNTTKPPRCLLNVEMMKLKLNVEQNYLLLLTEYLHALTVKLKSWTYIA